MKKQQLDSVLERGLVVRFASKSELYSFLQEVKSFGGRWISGEEIKLPEKPEEIELIFNLHIDREYVLSRVSAMCYHFGTYPTVDYKKFA